MRVGKNANWLLTGWAELGEGSSVTPSNGSAGRPELNASQSRHIVAQNGLSKLDGVRDDGSRGLSLGIETLGEILSNHEYHIYIRLDEDVPGTTTRLTSRLRTLPGTIMVKNCSAGAGRALRTA